MPTEHLQDHCTDGSNARSDGLPITDCPRDYGRFAAWWWAHGWRLEDERIKAFSDGAPRVDWNGKIIVRTCKDFMQVRTCKESLHAATWDDLTAEESS